MTPLQILNWLVMLRLPLGRWFNVPVYLHSSFLLIWGILMWRNVEFAIVWSAVFFIVLLHEFGHVLATKALGLRADDVVLYPIGGVASVEIPHFEPKKELVIALAGPAVNLVLSILSLPLWGLHDLVNTIIVSNVALMVFNLLPAFPMDGGRVARSLFAWFSGDWVRATLYAARLGQVLAGVFFMISLTWHAWGMCLIGIFVFFGADRELQIARSHAPFRKNDTADFVRSIDRRLSEIDRRFRP